MTIKIYYLDDEKDLCEIFEELVASPPLIFVKTYSDPLLFLEAVIKEKPDIVFTDYRMPKMNGEEVAKRLDPSIAKYLVTGEIDYLSNDLFKKVFKKPIDYDEISAEVLKLTS